MFKIGLKPDGFDGFEKPLLANMGKCDGLFAGLIDTMGYLTGF